VFDLHLMLCSPSSSSRTSTRVWWIFSKQKASSNELILLSQRQNKMSPTIH